MCRSARLKAVLKRLCDIISSRRFCARYRSLLIHNFSTVVVAERPRQHDNLTPMLSVTIGVVMALIIVAVIVMVVLRIQHSHVEEQNKSQMEDHAKQTKAVPIQRELRFREGCSLLADEKHPSSPFRKLDASGDLSESDEKNPDIIPQQITGPYFRHFCINPEFATKITSRREM